MKKLYLIWAFSLCILLGCETKKKILVPDMQQYQKPDIQKKVKLSYSSLKEANQDTIAILRIDNFIEEVIVQGHDNQQYLRVDFEGKDSLAGVNFMDYRCNLDSQNLILYGHSSKRQSIYFTPLKDYLEADFVSKHPIVQLETEKSIEEYTIFSILLFNVSKEQDNDWLTVDWIKPYLFKEAIQRLSNSSIISLEIPDVEINQIITLVTCNPKNAKERIVICAYKKAA